MSDQDAVREALDLLDGLAAALVKPHALAALDSLEARLEEAENSPLDYKVGYQHGKEAAEARLGVTEQALREVRPLVVELCESQRWTPVSGARRDWAYAMLAQIDAALADPGGTVPADFLEPCATCGHSRQRHPNRWPCNVYECECMGFVPGGTVPVPAVRGEDLGDAGKPSSVVEEGQA